MARQMIITTVNSKKQWTVKEENGQYKIYENGRYVAFTKKHSQALIYIAKRIEND